MDPKMVLLIVIGVILLIALILLFGSGVGMGGMAMMAGNIVERLPSDDGISFNIRKCVVAEYFREQGAADLCVGT